MTAKKKVATKAPRKGRKQVAIPEESVQVLADIRDKLSMELLGIPVTESQALAWALKKVSESI